LFKYLKTGWGSSRKIKIQYEFLSFFNSSFIHKLNQIFYIVNSCKTIMLYAVLILFFSLLVGSGVVAYLLTLCQGTWFNNFVIVFLVCMVIWLFWDNLSIMYDVKSRRDLRKALQSEYRVLDILRMERHEMYRDLRHLNSLKHKEIRRNAIIHSSSETF